MNQSKSVRWGCGWLARKRTSATEMTSITPNVHRIEPARSRERNEPEALTGPMPAPRRCRSRGNRARAPSR